MRTFLTVLKNNYYRSLPRIVMLSVLTLITLATMLLAVYFTKVQVGKAHIAYVTMNTESTMPVSSKALRITVLSKTPPNSDLVKQKYDAYVTKDEWGEYEIHTLRSQEYKEKLMKLLKNPNLDVSDEVSERGSGVNIIGFMMMFLLMMTFGNLFVFADDKEQGQLCKITVAPASLVGYFAAHCVYCLSLLLPEYLLVVLIKLFGGDIGFSLLEYAGLMCVMGFLGISFAILLHTVFTKPDNASMFGSAVIILTTILGGSFYSFHNNHSGILIKLLPQKELMIFSMHLQNGNASSNMGSLVYVIVFSFAMLGCSCLVLHRKYIKKI